MALVDTGPMRRKAEQAAEYLTTAGRFVWMYGGQGAGRDIVLDALQARLPDQLAIIRMAPLTSPDAVAHARLQLAVLSREDRDELELLSGSTREALASSLRRLQERERILVLRIHPTWEEGPGAVEQTLEELARSFVRQLGAALKDASSLRVLVLAGSPRRGALSDLGYLAQHELNLAAPQLAAGALEDEALWRTLRDDFRSIRAGLNRHRPTPSQLRMGVALVSLGDSPGDVARLLRSQEYAQLQPLIQRLRPRLAHSKHAPLLRRAAFARFALPWDKLLAAVPELKIVEDLVRVGLGYETHDGRVRLSEPVRRALLLDGGRGEKLADKDLETHARFAQTWAQLDGVVSPQMLEPSRVIPWLEKMHHRCHSGGYTREQLKTLDLPAPEFYWDMGRALSREQERFEDAAIVYRRCWEKFEHDDYAHHYYAWNLDRAARQPEEVERHYELAINERPDNVWWHARLCTFLIQRARFRDAEEKFRQALLKLDPAEVEVRRDARFARSLHRWVVEAWLAVGEIERANEVLTLIPPEVVSASDVLQGLAARVADAVEAMELGESVYPASLAIESRWKKPTFVPEEEDCFSLLVWHPGRVRRVDDTGIELVYVKSPEQPDARELHGLELSHADWRKWARGRRPETDAFVIIADYQQGLRRLFHWPAQRPNESRALVSEEFDSLRYVHQWLRTTETSQA